MAIPHIGHGRVIKYGGNDAANSRDISMMPGDFKKMGDQNKDMSPVKFISGAGSKQGAAKMMQQSYGAPAPGPAKNKPCPPGENCDEEGFRYITQSRLDSNALDSNASGATSANALGGALNEVVVTGNKNNTSPPTQKKGKQLLVRSCKVLEIQYQVYLNLNLDLRQQNLGKIKIKDKELAFNKLNLIKPLKIYH